MISDPAAQATVFIISVYDGYLNAGVGTMLLAAFGVIGMTSPHRVNGLKNLKPVVLSIVSVVTCSVA